RGVDPATERGEQCQPPIAELVAEPLDDDPLVRRQRPRRVALVLEVREQVLRRPLIEVVVVAQPLAGLLPATSAPSEVALELADERPECPTQLDGPADGVALPERQLA